MTTQPIDLFDDVNHRTLYKLSKLVDVPEFVKTASLDSPTAATDLPQGAFADPVHRKFPMHTKVATWKGQLYFLESRHLYTKSASASIQAKIDRAADYWGIAGHVKAAATTWTEKHSAAAPELTDADYAMVVKQGEQTHRKFPINNELNVKAAANHMYQHRGDYPYDWRLVAARKILRKSAEYHAMIEPEVEEYLTKAAGFGSTLPLVAAEKLAARVLMLPMDQMELREKGAKLAISVGSMKDVPDPEEMIKLARLVDRLDREVGLNTMYDEAGVDTPEELFFSITEKTASDFKDGHVALSTGTIIPIDLLGQIPLDKIAEALGDDFLSAVKSAQADSPIQSALTDPAAGHSVDIEKFARLAATLPLPDAQLLENLLGAAGVKKQGSTMSLRDQQGSFAGWGKKNQESFFGQLGKVNDAKYGLEVQLRHPQNVDHTNR